MPARETSAWFPAILLQDKPSQLQYLQNYVPRRPDLPDQYICEGEIKDFNFAVCVDTSPRYFGITYKIIVAKEIYGNLIPDASITASIPNESVPIVRFDASKATLGTNDSFRSAYYKLVIVLPGGSCYHSEWTPLIIRRKKKDANVR